MRLNLGVGTTGGDVGSETSLVVCLSLGGSAGGDAGSETLMGFFLGVVVVVVLPGVASWWTTEEAAAGGLVKQVTRAWHFANSLV